MPKTSVIVPVYNSSKYLGTCIESILNQDEKDLEIILVDDKSKDSSLDILEQYRAKYPSKIKIVENASNKGPGFSRNEGLKLATGEYIGFVDSDDYIKKDMYSSMIERALKNNDDIVITDMDLRFMKMNFSFLGRKVDLKEGIYNPKLNKDLIINSRPSACNKLFKGELIGNTKFPEHLKWEDYPFVILMLALSNKIEVINKKDYHYRINILGTTVGDIKEISPRLLDIFEVSDILENGMQEHNIKDIYLEELRTVQIINCLGRVRDLAFKNIPEDKKSELINLLLNLIEIKYGDWQNNRWYKSQKENNLFYRMRMENIEKYYLSDFKMSDEKMIKQKIKRLI